MEFVRHMTAVERALFAVAFLIFIVSVTGVLLFNRIFSKPLIDPADVIAKVVTVSHTVQRHTPFMFEFQDLTQDDVIGNGDTVFSGSKSSASIQFTQGSWLTIGPDSMVVIRMRDGKLEVKIDKGTLSGRLMEKAHLEVQSQEEAIDMNGSSDSEFELTHRPKVGIELKNFVKAKPASQQTDSGENAPTLAEKSNGPHPATSTDGKSDRTPSNSREEITGFKPASIRLQDGVHMKPKKYNLKTPYPADHTVVLHKSDFELGIFPKSRCEFQCRLDIYLDGQLNSSKEFEPQSAPQLNLKFAKSTEGVLKWVLKENGVEITGEFEILEYSENNFANAIRDKRSIEVVD